MNRLNSKYGKTISRLLKCECNIIDLTSRMSNELGKIERLIKFEGFEEVGLTPTIEISTGDEILILCKGYELVFDVALDIIEINGCIRPEDIPGVKSNLLYDK